MAISHADWFLAPYCIGMKLRSLRTEKRLTLARLSAETGLSTALLSKLETDRMTPTLHTLAAICRIYGVGLGHFFGEPTGHSLSVTRELGHLGHGRISEPCTCILLNSGVAGRKMDASLIDLQPGSAASPPISPSYADASETALLIYVLHGRLHLDVGSTTETLETGDCAYLESDLPLAWAAAGKESCRILTVTPSASRKSTNESVSETIS